LRYWQGSPETIPAAKLFVSFPRVMGVMGGCSGGGDLRFLVAQGQMQVRALEFVGLGTF
jgi:hypothetical protein